MYVSAPVYSEQSGVHFINIYNEQEDGTFRRTQDEPLRLLRNNIKGVSNTQGELLTSASDRTERSWNTATVTFHYGHPKSFYTFLREMFARNKYFVFSKPQLSGRISRFNLHELVMKPGTSQRHLSLLKEKYLESVKLWTMPEWEKKQEEQELLKQAQLKQEQQTASTAPTSLDVDFGQGPDNHGFGNAQQSEFIDLKKFGAPISNSVSSNESGLGKSSAASGPIYSEQAPDQENLIKRYGEVAGAAGDHESARQFPSGKKERKSHFLERFIFTVD